MAPAEVDQEQTDLGFLRFPDAANGEAQLRNANRPPLAAPLSEAQATQASLSLSGRVYLWPPIGLLAYLAIWHFGEHLFVQLEQFGFAGRSSSIFSFPMGLHCGGFNLRPRPQLGPESIRPAWPLPARPIHSRSSGQLARTSRIHLIAWRSPGGFHC